MGSRAKSKTGWNSAGTVTPPYVLTPDELNLVIPYSQTYIPARAMNPGNSTSSPSFLEYNIGSRELGFGVWVMAKSTPGKVVSFEIDVHGSTLDVSNPEFVVYPVFFQDNDDTVSGLEVEWNCTVTNRLIGQTLDVDYDPAGQNNLLISPVRNRLINSGGSVTDAKNGAYIDVIEGSTLQADQNNTIVFMFERHSDFASSDTYTKAVLLRGVIVQWKNNFNNLAKIPGVHTP